LPSDRPILLIGGTGFLGSALRKRLADHEIVVVGRSEDVSVAANERYFPASELDGLEREFAGRRFAAIIDFAYATVPSTSFEDPVRDFSVNLGSAIHHLELARRLATDRYIFVSSGGTVYGDSGADAASEAAANSPRSPYGISKLACEHYARLYQRLHGVPACIVRPSNIYGPGQVPFRGQGLVATAFGAARTGQPLAIYGDGSQVRDYLFIDDFCAAFAAIMEKGEPGEVYNVGSGEGTSVRQLLDAITEIAGPDGKALDVDWREARPFDVDRIVLDSSKLRQLTGWEPETSLEDGLEATWAWMKGQ
jgi:UDP-glucose 4-epimerase